MNYFIFNTGGDWDSTGLYLNGDEFAADRLYLKIETGRDYDGEPRKGGLRNGGQGTCYANPQGKSEEWAIFPGKIDLEFPTHKVTLENQSPTFALELTKVTLDGQDVSDELLDLEIDVNAINDQVTAYLTLYKPKLFGADEIATYTLI